MTHYSIYFKALTTEGTEHTNRGKLETLLNAVAESAKLKLKVIPEPKRDRVHGAPDYLIKQGESIVGYVENKPIGTNLHEVLKSDQIKKYKDLSPNILLTNYHEFIWIKKGKVQTSHVLCPSSEIGNKKYTLGSENISDVDILIRTFLSQEAEAIGRPQRLAETLAVRTKYLKDILFTEQ